MDNSKVTLPATANGVNNDDLYEEQLRKQYLNSIPVPQMKPVALFEEELRRYEQKFVKNRLDSKGKCP